MQKAGVTGLLSFRINFYLKVFEVKITNPTEVFAETYFICSACPRRRSCHAPSNCNPSIVAVADLLRLVTKAPGQE